MSKRKEEFSKGCGTGEERLQQARWLVVKSMLEAFPSLRKMVKKYLKEE